MEEKEDSTLTPQELRNRIEAILFASGKKVDVYFIKDILGIDNVRKIKNSLEKLKTWYDENSTVLMVNQEGDLWKMNVRENYSNVVRKLISETDLPRTVLETLSVIAWKSPVYQSEIVNIRGAGAYEHISLLVETSFVTKEKHGRSYILKVTNKFFEYFDIEGNEGIKDVFKKIKEKPEQKKVEEFNENETESEEKLENPELTEEKEELNKVGKFDVIDIEQTEPEKKIDEESETLGKLEVFEEQEDSEQDSEKIFNDQEDFVREDEEVFQKSEEPINEEVEKEDDASKRTKEIVEELLDEEEKTDEVENLNEDKTEPSSESEDKL